MENSTTFDSYRYAFESCKTYKDGAVNPSDFAAICRRFKQDHNTVINAVSTDGEGRYTLSTFIQYMKQQHNGPAHSHHGYPYEQEGRFRVTSPTPPHRPSSGSKLTRQSIHPSSSSHHHHHAPASSYRHATSSRYTPVSPTVTAPSSANPLGGNPGGIALAMSVAVPFNDSEDCTPEELQMTATKRRQEMMRTPEHYISAEEKTASRLDHDRLRLHSTPHSSHINSTRPRPGAISRSTMDSPPPHSSTHHTSSRRSHRDPTRSDIARYRDEDSGDDDVNQESFYPPPPTHSSRSHSGRKCKNCDRQKETYSRQLSEIQEDLKVTRQERERLEQYNEKLRKDLQMAQNADVAYGQLYHENEKLRQEIKRFRSIAKETSDIDQDRGFYDRQKLEDLMKAKEDAIEECAREKSAHKAYKKECAALKAEYNILRLKNEELQRSNWQLKDENQMLLVRSMEGSNPSSFSRHPGDGDSGENSVRSTYASEIGFHRKTNLRQTYHFTGASGKNEVTRDSSRSHRSRLEMKRTSSEGKALDYDEPVKESAKHESYRTKAKTNKSAGTSDVGSVGENLLFSFSTGADEQTQVFMVLDEDVSKSVLPESLPKEQELALIYALQNCHSIQDIIKCLVSFRAASPSDKLSGFQVENEHLKCCVDHLNARLSTMTNSFEKSKEDMISMYHKASKFEANNMRLRHALKLCQQACEVYEVLMDYKNLDPRHHGSSNSTYYPSFDSFDTATRSPDREGLGAQNSLPSRARALLNQLESNPELQSYLPYGKLGKGEFHGHWPLGTLSQNTGTTSGLSSMSGGTDVEITSSDLERLKQYSQALLHYESHLIRTMMPVDGLNGLATVKKKEELSDSLLSEQSGRGDPTDMEDAAHAEELCKIREEKAELKSQIYMMEQEKRRMELEVGRLNLQKHKSEKVMHELQFLFREEKRKRKKERKRKTEAGIPTHESNHMSELSIEYSSALEREKELSRRYEDLFNFLRAHIKDSQDTTDELMRFVKELRRANSGLMDAFDKSKKRQQLEKRRMKQELVSYMNRLQASGAQVEEPSNGPSLYP